MRFGDQDMRFDWVLCVLVTILCVLIDATDVTVDINIRQSTGSKSQSRQVGHYCTTVHPFSSYFTPLHSYTRLHTTKRHTKVESGETPTNAMFAPRHNHAFRNHQPDKENMISQTPLRPGLAFKTPMTQRTLHPSSSKMMMNGGGGIHTVGPKRVQMNEKDGSKTEFKSRIGPSLNRNGSNVGGASPFAGKGKGKAADLGKPQQLGNGDGVDANLGESSSTKGTQKDVCSIRTRFHYRTKTSFHQYLPHDASQADQPPPLILYQPSSNRSLHPFAICHPFPPPIALFLFLQLAGNQLEQNSRADEPQRFPPDPWTSKTHGE